MKNYYMIPLTEDNVLYKGELLDNILKIYYNELYQREAERISILYATSPCILMPKWQQIEYENFIKKTKEMYDRVGIPQFLIAKGNDDTCKEIATHITLKSLYPAALGVRQVSHGTVFPYLNNSYNSKVLKLYETISKKTQSRINFVDVANMALIYVYESTGNILLRYDSVIEFEKTINKNLKSIDSNINYNFYNKEQIKIYNEKVDEKNEKYLVLDKNIDLKEIIKYYINILPKDIVLASQTPDSLEKIGLCNLNNKFTKVLNKYNLSLKRK